MAGLAPHEKPTFSPTCRVARARFRRRTSSRSTSRRSGCGSTWPSRCPVCRATRSSGSSRRSSSRSRGGQTRRHAPSAYLCAEPFSLYRESTPDRTKPWKNSPHGARQRVGTRGRPSLKKVRPSYYTGAARNPLLTTQTDVVPPEQASKLYLRWMQRMYQLLCKMRAPVERVFWEIAQRKGRLRRTSWQTQELHHSASRARPGRRQMPPDNNTAPRIREFRHVFTGHRRIMATVRVDLARVQLLCTGESPLPAARGMAARSGNRTSSCIPSSGHGSIAC